MLRTFHPAAYLGRQLISCTCKLGQPRDSARSTPGVGERVRVTFVRVRRRSRASDVESHPLRSAVFGEFNENARSSWNRCFVSDAIQRSHSCNLLVSETAHLACRLLAGRE